MLRHATAASLLGFCESARLRSNQEQHAAGACPFSGRSSELFCERESLFALAAVNPLFPCNHAWVDQRA